MSQLRNKLVDPEEVKRRSMQFEQNQGASAPSAPEAEAIEGDITDYIMPIKGMGRNILKAVVEKGVKEGAKVAGKEALKEGVKDAEKGILKYGQKMLQKPAVEGPNYKNENIAFRPTEKPKQVGWENYSLRERLNK